MGDPVYKIVPNNGFAFGPFTCSATGANAPAGTTFTDLGGKKLSRARIVPIFWGTEWAFDKELIVQITDALSQLITGPYFSYLVQYGVHRPTLLPAFVDNTSDPPSPTFSNANVGNFVSSKFGKTTLPEPDSSGSLIYAVFMPNSAAFQGVSPPDTLVNGVLPPGTVSNVVGYNFSIVANSSGPAAPLLAYILWVGKGNLDFITTIASHELAEIMTDPSGSNGVIQTSPPPGAGANQIGDPCTNICDSVRGVKAQSYFSIRDGQCVVPKVYSVRTTLADRNIGGRISSLGSPIPSLNQLITSLF